MAQLGSWDFVLHRTNSPCAWPFGASGQFVAGGPIFTHNSVQHHNNSARPVHAGGAPLCYAPDAYRYAVAASILNSLGGCLSEAWPKYEAIKSRTSIKWNNVNMKRYLSFGSSIFTVISYLLFAFLSLVNFPAAYSPMSNWLSDLGSYQLNPRGAIFYNLGVMVAGISALSFFMGLSSWALAGNKKQNAMLFLTQLFGSLGSLSMVMSALFPINIEGTHAFWSASLYILMGTAFAFSVATLRYHSRYPRWLLFLGVLVAIEDVVWSVALNIYILEWVTVALFLLYILLLGIETQRKALYVE
jgi:hypothetical protein